MTNNRMNLPRIYIIGPVNTVRPNTECDQFGNVRRMVDAATDLINLGMDPIVPALCSFWHMLAPQPRAFWIAKGQNDMRSSDACFRIHGKSSGADADEAYAGKLGLEVFRDLERIAAHFAGTDAVDCAVAYGVAEYQSEIAVPIDPKSNGELVLGPHTNKVAAMHPSAVECKECRGTGYLINTLKTGPNAGDPVRVKCLTCKGEGFRI